MFYVTSLVLTYEWEFVSFDHLAPTFPPSPTLLLLSTNLISFFYEFAFWCFSFAFFGCATQHAAFLFPNQGLNLWPLQWKCDILTTGPPGKSLCFVFKFHIWMRSYSIFFFFFALTYFTQHNALKVHPHCCKFGRISSFLSHCIQQCLSFCDGLISLSTMSSSFSCVIAYDIIL